MYSAVLRVSLGTLQRRYITTITSSVTTEFRDEDEAQLFWLVRGAAGGGRAAEDFLDSADCFLLVSALVAGPREPLACTASLLQQVHGYNMELWRHGTAPQWDTECKDRAPTFILPRELSGTHLRHTVTAGVRSNELKWSM